MQIFNTHLKNDPTESNNVAADNHEKLKSMLKAMANQLKAMGAQYPERNGQPVKLIMP